jgi:hypothetical protein
MRKATGWSVGTDAGRRRLRHMVATKWGVLVQALKLSFSAAYRDFIDPALK